LKIEALSEDAVDKVVKAFNEDYMINLSRERVRAKLRAICGDKKKKEKKKSKKLSDSSDSSDDDDDDVEEDDEEDLEDIRDFNFHKPNTQEYHKSDPEPWRLDLGEEGTLFLFNRKTSMKPNHIPDHDDIHMKFTIPAPTRNDIDLLLNKAKAGPGVNRINVDLDNESVVSQITKWTERTWSVKIPTVPPLKPMDFVTGKSSNEPAGSSKLSWVYVPSEAKTGKEGGEIGDMDEVYVNKSVLNVELGKNNVGKVHKENS